MSNSMRTIAGLITFACILACPACEPQQKYVGLAKAGTTYTQALDKLLDASISISIDATSERMLQNRDLSPPTQDDYVKQTAIDRERVQILRRLQTHARLLGQYFQLLNDLASSKAPAQVGESIGGVADQLNKVSQQLRGASILSNQGAVSTGGQLVVGAIIRGQLRNELEKRKDTIDHELHLQEELLKALGGAIDADLTQINQAQEWQSVIKPFLASAPIQNPDQWMSQRRRLLTTPQVSKELNDAAAAVSDLRAAFEALVAGTLNPERVNDLISEFDSILDFTDTLK